MSFQNLVTLLGGSTEHEEIAFLKAKAREGKHWSLLSGTLLEEAKMEMYAVCSSPYHPRENVDSSFAPIVSSLELLLMCSCEGRECR